MALLNLPAGRADRCIRAGCHMPRKAGSACREPVMRTGPVQQ